MRQLVAFHETKHRAGNRAHLKLENIDRFGEYIRPHFENRSTEARALRAGWKTALLGVLACVTAFAQAPTITTSLGRMAITQAVFGTNWPPDCKASDGFCWTGRTLLVTLAMQDGGEINLDGFTAASAEAYVLADDGTKSMRLGWSASVPSITVDLGFAAGPTAKNFRLFWPGNDPVDLGPLLAPTVSVTSVSNGASFLPGIASGSWITIMGTNLSATTRNWTQADFKKGVLPLSLDGVSVKVNNKAAPVYFISPTQINALAPPDTATGSIALTVTTSRGTSNTLYTTLQGVAPGWFACAGGKYPASVHADGTYVGPAGIFGTAAVAVPAKPNETILLYGTGFGKTKPAVDPLTIFSGAAPLATPNDLRVTVGGLTATVAFAGLVMNGEYQFNIVVPNLPDGEHDLIATIGGAHTQTVKLMIQAPPAATCSSNCVITTAVGKFAVTNAQIGDSFPLGCSPGPGCSPADAGFEVLVVSLGLQGSLKGNPLDLSNPKAYVLAEDGSKAPVFAGGLMSGEYFIAFTPKATLRKFHLFWPGNGAVDLSQFLP
jgi:uncharacterized protein (TIGR03437 family)